MERMLVNTSHKHLFFGPLQSIHCTTGQSLAAIEPSALCRNCTIAFEGLNRLSSQQGSSSSSKWPACYPLHRLTIFYRQVIEKRIPIAINVLCHLAEFLSSSVILARVRFRLHNVTLPRGWLLHLLQQITVREAETQFLDRLLDCMRGLLESLINGGDAARTSDSLAYLLSRQLNHFALCQAISTSGTAT